MSPQLLQSLINKLKKLPGGTDTIILDSKPKIRVTHLYNIENSLKIKLSIEYKQFLMHHNGGYPTLDKFDYIIDSNKCSSFIAYFLSICDNNDYSLIYYIQTYKDKIPENMIPIAVVRNNNLLLIELITNKIYVWDSRDNISLFVAEGFNTFLKNLY